MNRGREKRVNIKADHRIMKIKGWLMHRRPKGLRPRVEGWASRTSKPDVRWAVDMSDFMTKKDGWCHITAVTDCCDRSIVGWRVSKSGKAKVAAAALEDALIKRRPECLWLRQFETVEDARSAVASFIDVHHNERPYRSLDMLTPSEWMERFAA